jgi:hypothetical protein
MSTDSVSGYSTHDSYFATRFIQGKRRIYAIELTPTEISAYLPKPDPDRPTEGNRRVRLAHAAAFGSYIREHEEWVCPAILLRAPDMFEYEATEEIGSTQFGVLGVPKLARSEIRILDGQHRILGIHLALEAIANELESNRDGRAKAKKNGSPAAVLKVFEDKIAELEHQRKRLSEERLSVQVAIEDDSTAYKQMFVDIADNALGISSSIRTRFDNRKVVNRCVEPVSKHALLAGRVDAEQDRMSAKNPNLVGAKHVAEIVRTVTVGLSGRISRRQEQELREDALVETTNEFLDTLLAGFDPLAEVADGDLAPEDLRKASILGSTSVLRVLAGVYFELRQDGWEEDAVADFFVKLSPFMYGPVSADSPWVTQVPGEVFSEGAMGPRSRRQDLKALADAITAWAKNRPQWLDAETAAPKTA